jgi:hypothetical protein
LVALLCTILSYYKVLLIFTSRYWGFP